MKLHIVDSGDPSVGIMSESWTVECPLNKNDDKEEIEWFRNQIISLYKECSDGRISATYDFEYEAEEIYLNELEDSCWHEIQEQIKKLDNEGECSICHKNIGTWRENPYIFETKGISQYQFICTDCYNTCIQDC